MDCPSYSFFWPSKKFPQEAVILFTTDGGLPLSLVSNYPYEVWLDGVFIGDGGHRCAPGEVFIDQWPEAESAEQVEIRLHYMNNKMSVYHRCLFEDPFFGQHSNDPAYWACYEDTSISFKARACNQLPAQNLIDGRIEKPFPFLQTRDMTAQILKYWKILPSPIHRFFLLNVLVVIP